MLPLVSETVTLSESYARILNEVPKTLVSTSSQLTTNGRSESFSISK